MAGKLRPVEPEIRKIIEALGLGEPTRITFVKTGKLMFTVDEWSSGIRVIYSDAFLDKVRISDRREDGERP